MKKFLHITEALIVKMALAIFGLMPFAMASNIGGFLGRKIGPLTPANETARRNINLAMPELSEARVSEILTGMWDNLGRVITEYSQLSKLTREKVNDLVTIEGQVDMIKLVTNKGGFLLTGHFGNWEMTGTTTHHVGCKTHIVYRKANNPYVDKIICDIRKTYQTDSSPKGSVGARKIIQSIKKGLNICMLIDQKQNDGISVPFFGMPAMTAPAIATLALKYNCTIYPGRIVRINGTKFKFIMSHEINITKSGDNDKDILLLMTQINKMVEGWVREYPEQWFWVHNRWPKTLENAHN